MNALLLLFAVFLLCSPKISFAQSKTYESGVQLGYVAAASCLCSPGEGGESWSCMVSKNPEDTRKIEDPLLSSALDYYGELNGRVVNPNCIQRERGDFACELELKITQTSKALQGSALYYHETVEVIKEGKTVQLEKNEQRIRVRATVMHCRVDPSTPEASKKSKSKKQSKDSRRAK